MTSAYRCLTIAYVITGFRCGFDQTERSLVRPAYLFVNVTANPSTKPLTCKSIKVVAGHKETLYIRTESK
jgi:hypothetical protein